MKKLLLLCKLGVTMMACGSKSAATSPSTTTTTTTTATANVTISIVANSGTAAFTPNPATVPAGQTLVFRNNSTATHHIVSDTGAWDSGNVAPGASSTIVTIAAGAGQPFHCTIHGSMIGTLSSSTSSSQR